MKNIKVRIPEGKTVLIRDVELFTVDEAKKMLAGKEWEVGTDIYSATQTNKRVGWLASFPNGDGIFVEAR